MDGIIPQCVCISSYGNIPCIENDLIEPENSVVKATSRVLTVYSIYIVYKATMEAESRLNSLNAQDFEALMADKDSENTKKSTKVAIELFRRCLAGTDDFLYSVLPFS